MRTTLALAATAGLIGSLLTGGAASAVPPSGSGSDTTDPSLGSIAIVPLDDRPFTEATPAEIARAGGHTQLQPPIDDLGAFLEPADADGVGEWWRDSSADADASVVAIPMLAYGGLVASRSCDATLETARERLSVIDDVAAAQPDQPIYAFDVIQRLATTPTGTYPGTYAGAVRTWAVLEDRVVNLGHEELRDEYEEAAAAIPQEIKDDYRCSRARNHEINRDSIRAVAEGVIDFLILGQDDASEYGPHRAEKEELVRLVDELGVADRVKIYPGADVLGALLTGKLVLERLDRSPTVSVEWSRTHGDDWIAHYQDIPYGTLVDEYVTTLGAQRDDAGGADVALMANTGGAGSLVPFADRIHEQVARGALVAIGDEARAGVVDGELRDLVASRIDLGRLGGWSGWNVGVSLTQAVVRAALLDASRDGLMGVDAGSVNDAASERWLLTHAAEAHQRLTFMELVHTDRYRNEVRADVKAFAEDAGDDPQHMTQVWEDANRLAVDRTIPLARDLFDDEFVGVPMDLGEVGGRTIVGEIGDLGDLGVQLAWPRYQEIDVHADVDVVMGEPASPASVDLVPSERSVIPETEQTFTWTAIARNDTAHDLVIDVEVRVPEGWSVSAPSSVALAPLTAQDVEIAVTTPAVAAGAEEVVEAVAVVDGDEVASSSGTVTARLRNVAAASEGAVATASGWWGSYEPGRAIDGNSASIGSRWITDVGDPHWLQVDFAKTERIDSVALHQYGGFPLRDYTVSASTADGWVEVAGVLGNDEEASLLTFDAVEADAIRLDIDATSDGRARLYEIEATCRDAEVCLG
ncbi:DUF4127 family protein [Microbacterium karelineae]|uniref:DUF4127 family protein n=1 Tax=Microbacterium karelineae TaxID=2654283 RepID=UPI0018D3B085|nr:DUF4127 family protein [Microbacterium karelineae]